MTNLKIVQKQSDLPFAGIELVRVNKAIREVVIGGKLRIKVANNYSSELELLVPAPYEQGTRHRLTATIDGFDPKVSYFDDEYSAKRASEDFEGKGATVAVEKVDVLIDEGGEVVSTANDTEQTAAEPREMADIPF